jgi:hypothetical protein
LEWIIGVARPILHRWAKPYICSNHEREKTTRVLDADIRSLPDPCTFGTLRILLLGFIGDVEVLTGATLASAPPRPNLKNMSQDASVSLPFELQGRPLQTPFSLFALN